MIEQAKADGTIESEAYKDVKPETADPRNFIELVAPQPDGSRKSVKIHKAVAAQLLGVRYSTANRHLRKASDRDLILALRNPAKVRKMVRTLADTARALAEADAAKASEAGSPDACDLEAETAAAALANEVAEAAAGGLPMIGLEADPSDDPAQGGAG